jgi:hypothetical protein
MKAHNKFQQQIIMHANQPDQTGTQTLIQIDTRHKGPTTGAKQYKKRLYTFHDACTKSLMV